MDIETTEFDSARVFSQMIKNHSLEELMQLDNNLLHEIKTLDTNMQTLVYENYNKFISATDTIRTMKTNVEGMEEELRKLENSMGKIEGLSKSVNGKLAPRQDEIKRLVDIHQEMQKIKFICDLPALLRAAIDANKQQYPVDFEEAAESYHRSRDFLASHKQDPSYISIYQEALECVEIIKKGLWKKIQDSSLPADVFVKYAKELILFGDESEKLPNLFCSYHRKRLTETMERVSEKSTVNMEIPQVVPDCNSDYAIDTIDQNVRVSLSESLDKSDIRQEGNFYWYIHQIHLEASPQISSAITTFKSTFCNDRKLIEFSRDLINTYMTNIKKKITEIVADINTFTSALHILNTDMHKFREIAPATDEIRVSDRFTELFEYLIRHQVAQVFEDTKTQLVASFYEQYEDIESSEEPLPQRIDQPVEKAVYNIMYSIIGAIMELEPIIESLRDYLTSGSMFVSLIISHVIELFQFIQLALTVGSLQYPVSPAPTLNQLHSVQLKGTSIIGLLKLSLALEDRGVPKLLSTLMDCYSGFSSSKGEIVDIIQRIAKPELLSLVKQSQELILQLYIEYYAMHFGVTIFEYTHQDWLYDKEPIDVSATICGVAADFKKCRKELKSFFTGEKPYQRHRVKRDKHQVELDMERLFARKSRLLGNVKFELNMILGSIIKLSLKNLYEEIRVVQLGAGGFQQVELDIEFLEGAIDELVVLEDPTLISGYIREIKESARLRCTESIHLERTLLETIIENKKESLKSHKAV